MDRIRKPFQGVWNIIRFNWHFYVLSVGIALVAFVLAKWLSEPYRTAIIILSLLISGTAIISLMVSFYVYDLSDLYSLNWLENLTTDTESRIVNIHAGFDETTSLIKSRFPDSELFVFDFYDPLKHTEVSIKRARKAYLPAANTQSVDTSKLPLPDNFVDAVFLILSAHEIRNGIERDVFFRELKRITKRGGRIIITEHLRNFPNFLAYNIGFFHFITESSWKGTFKKADMYVRKVIKITPFITTFILKKNGASS